MLDGIVLTMERELRHSCFEEYLTWVCERFGSRPLLHDAARGKRLSYSGFFKEVAGRKKQIMSGTVSRAENVLFVMENSIDSLVYLFALFVSGIRPVILSDHMSLPELIKAKEKIKAETLVCSSALLDKYRALGTDYALVDEEYGALVTGEERKSGGTGDAEAIDSLYIVLTTGTTSDAKMVSVSLDNFLCEIESMAEAYGLSSADKVMCVLPLYHASGFYRNFLIAFHSGSEIFLKKKFDGDSFWNDIEENQITFVQVVPSILRSLLTQRDGFHEKQAASLRYIGSASAPNPPKLITEFEEAFGTYILVGYGMTEATCAITANGFEPENRRIGSVGRPISVNRVAIVDGDGNELSTGQCGDIVVTGRNVTRYMDSGKNQGKDGVLETGDVGYLDDEGFLWLQSRRNDFIKRAGYRISAGEIEEAIEELFPKTEAAVIGVSHPLLGEDIIAFIKVDSCSKELSQRMVIRSVKKKLASYKIPSKVVFVDKLPCVGVGKIDKNELKIRYQKNK